MFCSIENSAGSKNKIFFSANIMSGFLELQKIFSALAVKIIYLIGIKTNLLKFVKSAVSPYMFLLQGLYIQFKNFHLTFDRLNVNKEEGLE